MYFPNINKFRKYIRVSVKYGHNPKDFINGVRILRAKSSTALVNINSVNLICSYLFIRLFTIIIYPNSIRDSSKLIKKRYLVLSLIGSLFSRKIENFVHSKKKCDLQLNTRTDT